LLRCCLLIWVIEACRLRAIRNFKRQLSETSDPPEPNCLPPYGGIIFLNVYCNIILHGVIKQNIVSTTPTTKV